MIQSEDGPVAPQGHSAHQLVGRRGGDAAIQTPIIQQGGNLKIANRQRFVEEKCSNSAEVLSTDEGA